MESSSHISRHALLLCSVEVFLGEANSHFPICTCNMHGKFDRVAYAPVLDAADIAGITRHSNLGSNLARRAVPILACLRHAAALRETPVP